MEILNQKNFQIIIVDDRSDDVSLELFGILKTSGYKVEFFKNTDKALEYVRSHPVHLCISEIVNPREEGMAFLKTLRMEFCYTTTLFILSDVKDLTQREALTFGASQFFKKPQHFEDILDLNQVLFAVEFECFSMKKQMIRRQRIPAHFKVSGTVHNKNFKGEVMNISHGGLFVVNPTTHCEPGDEIEFSIQTADGSKSVYGKGLTKWTRRSSTSPSGFGLEFVDINTSELSEFLDLAAQLN
jgi:CheY-like chemotaxis protein